jgi:hypothetical protein
MPDTTVREAASNDSLQAISARGRAVLVTTGLASWCAGGVAAFVNANGPASAALVVIGAVACVLALVGRWPTKISVSGGAIEWSEITATVDSQIRNAQSSGEESEVLAELQELRRRLEALRVTGEVSEHPAETFDRAVQAAFARILPGAVIERSSERSRAVADFIVRHDERTVYVETKWRRDVNQPFGGSTLAGLVARLPEGARLLVVANAVDVSLGAERLHSSMGDRAAVVSWRGATEDSRLAETVRQLLREN